MKLRRQSNRLSMIASRGGDDSVMRALRCEVMHEIQPTANFESPGGQVIFMLQENTRAKLRVEQRILHCRRRFQRAVNDFARGAYVFQRNVFS